MGPNVPLFKVILSRVQLSLNVCFVQTVLVDKIFWIGNEQVCCAKNINSVLHVQYYLEHQCKKERVRAAPFFFSLRVTA